MGKMFGLQLSARSDRLPRIFICKGEYFADVFAKNMTLSGQECEGRGSV